MQLAKVFQRIALEALVGSYNQHKRWNLRCFGFSVEDATPIRDGFCDLCMERPATNVIGNESEAFPVFSKQKNPNAEFGAMLDISGTRIELSPTQECYLCDECVPASVQKLLGV